MWLLASDTGNIIVPGLHSYVLHDGYTCRFVCRDGRIKIFGGAGVEAFFQSSTRVPCKFLKVSNLLLDDYECRFSTWLSVRCHGRTLLS